MKTMKEFIAKHFNDESSEYIKLEAKIVNDFLKNIVNLGYTLVYVHDGEDITAIDNNDNLSTLDAMFAVDQGKIRIKSPEGHSFNLYYLLGEGESCTFYDSSYPSQLSDEVVANIEDVTNVQFAKSVKKYSKSLYETYWA